MSDTTPTVQAADAPDTQATTQGETEAARSEFIKARDGRNKMIALGLIGFAALIFVITAMRLMQNIADRTAG